MSDPRTARIAATLTTPTGEHEGWRLLPIPSSGAMHPVRVETAENGHLHLRTDSTATVAKYGSSGVVSAEVDFGAALPAVVLLFREAGLQPSAISSATGLTVTSREVAAETQAAPASPTAADLAHRRSHRRFGPSPVDPLQLAAVTDAAHALDQEVRRMLPGLPLPSIHLAVLDADGDWCRSDSDGLTRIAGRAPDRDLLAEAACGQAWVADGWAVAVITIGEGRSALETGDAWALGAAASSMQLAATAAGLHACIVGAVRPDLLRSFAPETIGTEVVQGLTLLVAIGPPLVTEVARPADAR